MHFYYFGKRVEKSTGLKDTPENERWIRDWLDRQMSRIEAGQFVFAKAFPGASEPEKTRFAKLEGWQYQPEPRDVLFGEYAQRWLSLVWATWKDGTKKDDYRKDLGRLLPHFGELSFYQISGMEVGAFIRTLVHLRGKKKGQPLSRERIKNILIPLRAIWRCACDEYRWVLPDPLANLKAHLPEHDKERREGFRFDEWLQFLAHLEPWHQPVAELMLLTGLIASEVADLKKSDICDDYIQIRTTVVRGREKKGGKTAYRSRKIPITQAIQGRLDILLARSASEHLVTGKRGGAFRASTFGDRPWSKASQKSGVTGKVTYSLHHSFAAWSLILGMEPGRVTFLMGHSTRKMVYEVYGQYIEGLERDADKIMAYMGEDFLAGSQASPLRPPVLTLSARNDGQMGRPLLQ